MAFSLTSRLPLEDICPARRQERTKWITTLLGNVSYRPLPSIKNQLREVGPTNPLAVKCFMFRPCFHIHTMLNISWQNESQHPANCLCGQNCVLLSNSLISICHWLVWLLLMAYGEWCWFHDLWRTFNFGTRVRLDQSRPFVELSFIKV